jgi:flagellar protein FliJ
MRRFVWRLQQVLEVKTKQEQIKTQELFAHTEKLAQKRSELFTQQKILRDILDSITNAKPADRLSSQEFFLRNSAATDEKIKQIKKNVEDLEKKQKEMITELLKIRRFKEGLEKLREQAKRKFIEEQEKLEQKQLDEMATMSFARESILAGQNGDINQK